MRAGPAWKKPETAGMAGEGRMKSAMRRSRTSLLHRDLPRPMNQRLTAKCTTAHFYDELVVAVISTRVAADFVTVDRHAIWIFVCEVQEGRKEEHTSECQPKQR